MCFPVTSFYLRNKTVFLDVSWLWFFNVDVSGTPKIHIINIYDINSFQKILHFYPTLKNGGPKHDFFLLLNAPVGVHETSKNLLTRIGVRDLILCDNFFCNFWNFRKSWCFLRKNHFKLFPELMYYLYIILFFFERAVMCVVFFFGCFGSSQIKRRLHTSPPNFWCIAGHITRKM